VPHVRSLVGQVVFGNEDLDGRTKDGNLIETIQVRTERVENLNG
jgi:hypothetical protein